MPWCPQPPNGTEKSPLICVPNLLAMVNKSDWATRCSHIAEHTGKRDPLAFAHLMGFAGQLDILPFPGSFVSPSLVPS